MSKRKHFSNAPSIRYEGYAAIGYGAYTNIEGKVLTLIDAIGLPHEQCKALKDLLSQAIWSQSGGWPPLTHEEVDTAWKRHNKVLGVQVPGTESTE